jgi:hypothetical protein
VIVEWLRQHRQWQEAVQQLKIQREGGYAGIDALMFLLYYFASGLRIGIKEFSDRAREFHERLAAVGERLRLPTQASMSRILAAVDADTAQVFGHWLLRQAPGTATVLRHPSVLTHDATGAGWHVFDWDPTVTTLRHRALPTIEGTPEARRRSESMAARGYPGRKRGDVQFSRGTLQHAGSGLWLGIEMAPGNGSLRENFQAALEQVKATCEQASIERERTIVRADGAAGNVPFITACIEARVRYITRLAHYQLLQDSSIVAHLNGATWYEVPSSGSGPTRQAADLGRVVLEPAPGSLRTDGSTYERVEVRVVVSRFPSRTPDGRGAGVVIDSWQYELYATDLELDAWPEGEIVAGYYARSGQENRFFQEDRELGLDRIFSYHLPGQQLATLAGLFVWNFHICRGMDLARPPEALPEQPSTQAEPASESPKLPQSNSASDEGGVADSAHPDDMGNGDPIDDAPLTPEPDVASDASDSGDLERPGDMDGGNPIGDPHTVASAASASPPGGSSGSTKGDVNETMDAVDWTSVLRNHEGWRWSAPQGGLQCPARVVLPLIRIEQVKGKPIRARFQAPGGACGACQIREACVRSDDPHYRKDVRLPLPASQADSLRALWLNAQATTRRSQRARALRSSPEATSATRHVIWRVKPLTWEPPSLPPARPPFAVTPPFLLPAELRKLTRHTVQRVLVDIHLDRLPGPRRPSLVLATSSADRQKRRLSWEQRLEWNALPTGSSIELRLLGPENLALLIRPTADAPPLAKTG